MTATIAVESGQGAEDVATKRQVVFRRLQARLQPGLPNSRSASGTARTERVPYPSTSRRSSPTSEDVVGHDDKSSFQTS